MIICDDWGIVYVYGRIDVDVVFGMVYVQVEDDFYCVEINYLFLFGCMVEVKGELVIWLDLCQQLFIDLVKFKQFYGQSLVWLC